MLRKKPDLNVWEDRQGNIFDEEKEKGFIK